MRPIAFKLSYGRSHFIPAGCIHWPIGEKSILREWVSAVKEAEQGFTILMGDSMDIARTHYRDHIRMYRADQNSQLSLDSHIREDVERLAEELVPIRKKIAGAILGNHYWEFADGTNTEQFLCQLLEIPYLGPQGIVRVDYEQERPNPADSRIAHSLVIYAHHHGGSRSGGRTTASDVASLERTELSFEADIYALSHTHRRFGFKLPKLEVCGRATPRIVERSKAFIRSGAMLRGFGEDNPQNDRPHYPSYAEVNAYRPTDLGFVSCRIDLVEQADHTIKRTFTLSY